ncbi:hypothetical protein BD626DRAFT_488943 [Schizophyllum amplum]|uniref:CCZ1/INTU/HSP4 first Longin domain-containing protein n=1 Tax=Schizophyllum amplum TaxID=97359 RepID=A0A550CL29_9AGAR|nr:hypothetical protein BD626DRAFT_488943 [Auriculariopsis ampla]
MSRIPPNLLYLTIYNPTLRPVGPVAEDDEDAEEQAHILFYTSKERATSRDKMLRQVGLAKALVNFSAAFDAHAPCDNVHSQSKRMLMVSPERDFWIHAAIELARVPRPRGKDAKAKGKPAAPTYEYDESSVNDGAVRAAVLNTYERFKLTHGSFSSILANLGQEALELQLERFFTVWAWSWDLADGIELAESLAPPIHPLHRSLLPILDEFLQDVQDPASVLLVSPPHIVPSSGYAYAPSLSRHLLTLAPTPRPSMTPSVHSEGTVRHSEGTVHEKPPDSEEAQVVEERPPAGNDANANFMGLPPFSMPTMSVKLNWPGYLTFGKKTGKKSLSDLVKEAATQEGPKPEEDESKTRKDNATQKDDATEATSTTEDASVSEETEADSTADTTEATEVHDATSANLADVDVDLTALDDAISSISIPPPSVTTSNLEEHVEGEAVAADTDAESASAAVENDEENKDQQRQEQERDVLPSPIEKDPPEHSVTTVHIDGPDGKTTRRKISLYTRSNLTVAFIAENENEDNSNVRDESPTADVTDRMPALFDALENEVTREKLRGSLESLPSTAKILQPKDQHVIATEQYTMSSPGFTSRSEHLFDVRRLMDTDPDIREVFSRGQNPQYWHVGRRGLGNDRKEDVVGDIYMEVFRKEASLADVDNAVVASIRRSGLE